ncbi:hypothetical protein NIES2104_03350 [Leptolyngbya sp. NIES-2104]|nr:hypothetical protein NIES2104_03350 [Leptolyngbya sp. NIES-2104]
MRDLLLYSSCLSSYPLDLRDREQFQPLAALRLDHQKLRNCLIPARNSLH